MSDAPMPPRPSYQRLLDWVSAIFFGIGALGILALMGVTIVGVFWRYLLRDPIFGLQDVTSMIAVIVAACAVVVCATRNGHITVNIMPQHFGRRVRRVTDVIARLGSCIILTLATLSLIKKGGCGLACGNITSNLSIPHGPFYYALAVALGFVALYLAAQLIAGLTHWRSEDPNEAIE